MAKNSVLNREDKVKLIVTGYIILFVAMIAAFYFLNKIVNPIYIGLIWFAIHQLVVVPKFHRQFLELGDYEVNVVTSYIPLINETSIFSRLHSMTSTITGVATIIVGVLIALPYMGMTFVSGMIGSIFGEEAGMYSSFYFIIIGIGLYVLNNIARGAGFIECKQEIDRIHSEHFRSFRAYKPYEALMMLLLFIPFLRTIVLSLLLDRTNKMLNLFDLEKMNQTTLREEESVS